MNRKTVSVLAIVGVLLLFSLSASAQTRTGRILGQVHSVDGAPLAGATVTASSEVVMGGSRTAVTGETGAFRFAAMPPGVYDVMVTMDGHSSQTMKGISVTIGGTGTANFMLMPEFSEEMVVIGESPLVDVTSSGMTATYSAEFIKHLPTTRNFYDLVTVSPDVSISSEDSDRVIAGGSNMQSNN